MTRLLFGLVGVPAPRVHRWSHRAAFVAGVAAGVALGHAVLNPQGVSR